MIRHFPFFRKKKDFDYQKFIDDCLQAEKNDELERLRSSLITQFQRECNQNVQQFQNLAVPETGEKVVDSIAGRLLQQVKDGLISEGALLRRAFYRSLDRALIALLQSGEYKAVKEAEEFYERWFYPFLSWKQVKQKLAEEEGRIDAFAYAFSKFIAKLKTPGFEFTDTSKTFFLKAFQDECASVMRKKAAGKNSMYAYFLDDKKELLSPEIQNKLAQPPTSLLSADLDKLKALDPLCYELVTLQVQGYSYQELESRFQKTAKQLRQKASRCKEKFREAWNKLTR